MPNGLPRIGQLWGYRQPADAYTKAANVLRPVDGRMFIASPQYAAINTDGTGAITNGSAVGLWRDYVSGTATLTQATAGKKLVARQVPVLGPELLSTFDFRAWTPINLPSTITANSWTMASGGGGVRLTGVFTPGKEYSLVLEFATTGPTVSVFADLQKAVLLGSSAIRFTSDGTGFFYLRASTAGTITVSRIKIQEILGYTQQWEWVSDGSDDVLVGSPGPTLSDGLVMVWAGNNLNRTVGGRVAALVNTGATSGVAIYNESTGVSARVMVASTAVNTAIAATDLGANYVAALRLTSTTLQLRVNSGVWITLAHGRTLDAASLIPAVGAQTNTANFANADHSGVVYANLGANATDANIRILEEASAKAAGVTLL